MLSALVIYVEYEDANIAEKKNITRVSGISLRCQFHQFMIKRQTKTSIHLIMLRFIIIIYVKEYFIATFSIQPIVTTFLKNAKFNVLKLHNFTHTVWSYIHNVHKLTHLQVHVRYNLFVQFYNICIVRTHWFIPSHLNKLLHIPRDVNGMLLKTDKSFYKVCKSRRF